MKKIVSCIYIVTLIFMLSGCSFLQSQMSVDLIEENASVIKIETAITDVVDQVYYSCVGIQVKETSGTSTGSGLVYKQKDGYYYVITNEHVIKNALTVKIYTGEYKYYEATIIGKDSKNDLAILRFSDDIKNSKIKVYDIDADTFDAVVSGQTIIAIGCPLGLDYYNTVTSGIVSRTDGNRIQHDASLNPGNSGGALFNLSGRLIGINVSKIADVYTDEAKTVKTTIEGIGFAINMTVVNKCILDIEKLETDITRPLLGINVDVINRYISDEADVLLLPAIMDQGVIIRKVSSDTSSNSFKAGLMVGDIIKSINNTPIYKSTDVTNILSLALIGDEVNMEIYRIIDGKFTLEQITITLS